MSKNQQLVVWIGLVIVVIYLFTDKTFRDSLFGRGNDATTTGTTNVFLRAMQTQIGSSGLPASAAQLAPTNSKQPTQPLGGHVNQVN